MPNTHSLEDVAAVDAIVSELTDMLGGAIAALSALAAPDRDDSDLVKYERSLMEELSQGLTQRIAALCDRYG